MSDSLWFQVDNAAPTLITAHYIKEQGIKNMHDLVQHIKMTLPTRYTEDCLCATHHGKRLASDVAIEDLATDESNAIVFKVEESFIERGNKYFDAGEYLRALFWYRKAANEGDPEGCYYKGFMYSRGLGIDQDIDTATRYYSMAAEKGHAGAQNNLGLIYLKDNNAKAMTIFEKACKTKHAGAMYNLALMHKLGLGAPKDPIRAFDLFYQSAVVGNHMAMLKLAIIYKDGEHGGKDYAKAASWFHLSADAGNRQAQCNLGSMYFEGIGVKRDYERALNWFTKAAEAGDVKAIVNLGFMYESGSGVEECVETALHWYKQAAAAGDSDARSRYETMQKHDEAVQMVLNALHKDTSKTDMFLSLFKTGQHVPAQVSVKGNRIGRNIMRQ